MSFFNSRGFENIDDKGKLAALSVVHLIISFYGIKIKMLFFQSQIGLGYSEYKVTSLLSIKSNRSSRT